MSSGYERLIDTKCLAQRDASDKNTPARSYVQRVAHDVKIAGSHDERREGDSAGTNEQ